MKLPSLVPRVLAVLLGWSWAGASLAGPALSAAAKRPLSPAEVETMAEEAVREAPGDRDFALARARAALTSTVDFEPTAFVRAGRKGEVVEDDFISARNAYRKHRARLHAALGRVHAIRGEHQVAVRYLRRAELLGPELDTAVRLASSLSRLGRTQEAREVLSSVVASGGGGADLIRVLEEVVDVAGWPSVQIEIDRGRILALPDLEWRDGPLVPPRGTRLSTAPRFQLADAAVNVVYAAEASCRSCSRDIELLRRVVPASARIVVLPAEGDEDHALRQVLGLFQVSWPVLVGPGLASSLGAPPGSVLVVGREGWGAALVRGGPSPVVAKAVAVFSQVDLTEVRPRPGWNRRKVERLTTQPLAQLTPEGLAPGDDAPAPAEFEAAVVAYREKRPAEALRLLDGLVGRGDGWLLPAEGRLNRALCLLALGRREQARRLLLKTGDSRFQEAVDRALEMAGSGRTQ